MAVRRLTLLVVLFLTTFAAQAAAVRERIALRPIAERVDAADPFDAAATLRVADRKALRDVAYELVQSRELSEAVPFRRGVRFVAREAANERAVAAPMLIDANGVPSTRVWWEVEPSGAIHLNADDRGLTYPLTVAFSTKAAATARPRQVEANGFGSISGNVTNEMTGAPIEDEVIYVYDAAGNFVTFGITDSFGDYITYDGLDTGNYYIHIAAPGYDPELYDDVSCPYGCDVTGGTAVAVVDGADTPGIDFALASTQATISGVVTGLTSGPLPNMNVILYDGTGTPVAVAITGLSGSYQIVVDAGGPYYVRTYNTQYAGYIDQLYSNIDCVTCDPTTGAPITVPPGGQVSNINFALKTNGGRISGTITDATTNAPLDGSIVDVYNASGVWVSGANLDSNGDYISFRGLTAGNYFVVASAVAYFGEVWNDELCSGCNPAATGDPVAVTVGATTPSIDFALLSEQIAVSGRVTAASTSAPMQDVYVAFYDVNGDPLLAVASDANGDYAAMLPSTGTYYARTINYFYPGFIDQLWDGIDCTGCDVTGGTEIVAQAGTPITGIDFALTAGGGAISGTVIDAATSVPIPFASVQIHSSTGEIVNAGTTDSNGFYTTFGGLATGTYYAVAGANSYALQLYDGLPCNNCAPQSGTGISVVSGSTTGGVDFQLSAQYARVRGHVFSSSNTPVEGATVQLYDGNNEGFASATTDASGAYEVIVLVDGSYYAVASAGGYASQLYDGLACDNCVPSTGTAIPTTLGTIIEDIDFVLTPVGCPAITVSPSTLPNGNVGDSYSATFTSTGGVDPVTFTVSAGELPDSLILNEATGALTGTLTAAGTFTFTISATDASFCSGARTYTISVAPTGGSNPTTTTLAASPSTVTYPASFTLNATVAPSDADGAVTFFQGATDVGSVALSGGQASLVLNRNAGTYQYTASYGGGDGYSASTSNTVTVVVQKATPTVTWPTPAPITYPTPLSSTQLNATASVPGTFVYTPPSGTVLNAGTHTLSVTFTPTDSTNYNSVTTTVQLTVNKANQTITWAAPADIVYGTPLSGTQLNATVSVPGPSPAGAITYSPGAGSILDAGVHTLTVNVAGTNNYNPATAQVSLTVLKANQTIVWPTPANIVVGTPLSATQLNATVTVPGPSPAGAITYTPPAGTVLVAGVHILTVNVAGTNNYNPASAQVSINVVYGSTGEVTSNGNNRALVPFRITVTNAQGTSVASASLPVSAYGVRLASSATWTPVTDAFDYQNAQGGSYRFNFRHSLPAGSYVFGYTIGADPTIHEIPFLVQ